MGEEFDVNAFRLLSESVAAKLSDLVLATPRAFNKARPLEVDDAPLHAIIDDTLGFAG